jgi:hypothetical protein
MIILDGVTHKFQAVLAGATSTDQPEFQATYGQLDAGVLDNYASNQGELNDTTDVDIVAGVTSKQIGIKTITLYNRDSADVTITFKKDISGVDRSIYRVTLSTNESVHYESDRGWYICSASGAERSAQSEDHTGQVTGAAALSLAVAAITDQTALTSGLVGTDELLVSDGGVLKRMDISVFKAYNDALYEPVDATILKDADIGSTVQAYDADLTTWAGITPSANAQSLVSAATYAAMRTLLDLEAGTDFYSISAADAAFEPKDATILKDADIGSTVQAYDADLTTWAGITPSANAQSLVSAANYAAMKVLLDLEIGTDVQAYDADLTTWASITPSANAQSLVSAANYAAMRALLDLEIGIDVQAYDADLTTWAGITPSANAQSLVSAANYAAMRALLDLEVGTDFYSKAAVDALTWNANDITAGTLVVARGGTGTTTSTGTGSVVLSASPNFTGQPDVSNLAMAFWNTSGQTSGKMTISTSAASGGANGDIHFKY